MSAITGIFYRDGRSVSFDQIKKMNECLSHRGPDGQGIWAEESVALGHQMLHTTTESLQENLPFYDESTEMVITADARIDNRRELSTELGIENDDNVPDSIFILKAYQKWGDMCPEKLLGDFAFVIWDNCAKKLFCARDHMGVKQFYYHLSERGFFFATEIKALLSISEVPCEINQLMIAYHLTGIYGDKEITYYQDINHLPEAHKLIITNEAVNLVKYWELDPTKELVMDSDKEYDDVFQKIFFEAIKCRLRSKYKLGFLLSGGLDSSSITCVSEQILSQEKNEALKTFSAVFPDVPLSDESEYIKEVLKNGNFDPNFIRADGINPFEDADKIIWHADAPIYGPNRFIAWNIYKNAKNKGVRVIFDGFDGDTVISHGYGRLNELTFSFDLIKLLREFNDLSKISEFTKIELFIRYVASPIIPEKLKNKLLRNIWFYLNGIDRKIISLEYILNKEFAERIHITNHYKRLMVKPKINLRTEREVHYSKIQSGVLQFILEGLDLSAAAFQIEPRYPFLDIRLVEFCLSLPAEQKLNHGWERIILRRAMEGILPPKVQWRQQKSNLAHNFNKNFFELGKKAIEDMVLSENGQIQKFADIESIKNLLDESMSQGGHNHIHIMKLWRFITLKLWLENFRHENK